jgi:hypothetical protein
MSNTHTGMTIEDLWDMDDEGLESYSDAAHKQAQIDMEIENTPEIEDDTQPTVAPERYVSNRVEPESKWDKFKI